MGIVLLGYRGSGKTTIAKILGDRFGCPVIDTDDRVVAAAGQNIRDIFQTRGEQAFRDLEADAVRQACSSREVVVALGGGAILRPENRELLKQSGHYRIYLRCTPQVLHDRIHADPTTADSRPSLTQLGGSIDEIEQLLAMREPLYRSVRTHELDVTDLLPGDAAEAIVKKIEGER